MILFDLISSLIYSNLYFILLQFFSFSSRMTCDKGRAFAMREYILKKHIEDQNAKIKVYIPVISAEEREKRMQQIKKAAAALLR